MDGFLVAARRFLQSYCPNPTDPKLHAGNRRFRRDGYHDEREIPNYWAYARRFVLQDHMFEPNASWSLPEHLFMVSGGQPSARGPGDPSSCTNALEDPELPGPNTHYAWTDLTWLLHQRHITWAY